MKEMGRFARELRARIWKPSVEDEVRSELENHLEELEAEYIVRGMTPDAARAAARSRFGDVAAIEASCRSEAVMRDDERRRREWFGDLRQDVGFALRQMRSHRRFTVAAVLTLAVGIGAATTIFGLANAVLLRPLPWADPDRLVFMNETTPAGQPFSVSEPNYLDWRERMRSFSEITAFTGRAATLLDDGPPARLSGIAATHTLFAVLGAQPLLGRTFTPGEGSPGGDARVVVLSHGFWQNRLGSDPSVLSRTIDLDGVRHRIIGVMPASFDFFGDPDILVPLVASPDYPRGDRRLEVIGRLADGVTLERGATDVRRIAAELAAEHPATNEGWSAVAEPLMDVVVSRQFRSRVATLLAAVGLLLVMACVNVANLLIGRASARERELAVRAALGAGRGRLTRQLLTESAVLTLAGTTVGLATALTVWPVLERIAGESVPRLDDLSPDWRVAAFAAGACALTALVVGIVPALRLRRTDGDNSEASGQVDLLRAGTRVLEGGHLRNALVIASVALAMVLVMGAGLVSRSFASLMRVDLGFRPEQVITGQIVLPTDRERYAMGYARVQFFENLLTRIEALPGVEAAGAGNIAPFTRGNTAQSFWPADSQPATEAEYQLASWRAVTPGYFASLGIPLLRGRVFDDSDQFDAQQVIVINETMARAGWGDDDPVGRQVTTSNGQTRTIIGVVGDARLLRLDSLPQPTMYWPLGQFASSAMWIVVRTDGDPTAFAAAVRREVAAVDPTIPIARVQPMTDLVADGAAEARLTMLVFAIFATAALVLAAAGLYGVIAFGVAQRTREIGVRLAIGAEPARVLRMVLGHGMRLAVLGLLIGGVVAWSVSGMLRAILFGIEPSDVPTWAGVTILLIGIAAVASLVPAWRAARLDPVVALRSE
jgi:predicted permease